MPRQAAHLLPVLHILMRSDLASLTPGKACAHAAHAANAFTHHVSRLSAPQRKRWGRAVDAWMRQTPQGFGTTIVKSADIGEICGAVARLRKEGFIAGIVHDPEYPLTDGAVTHLIALDTCGYVFGSRADLRYLTSFPLMA